MKIGSLVIRKQEGEEKEKEEFVNITDIQSEEKGIEELTAEIIAPYLNPHGERDLLKLEQELAEANNLLRIAYFSPRKTYLF